MPSSLSYVGIASVVLAVGCGGGPVEPQGAPDPTPSRRGKADSVEMDRNRTCPGGCAATTVCDTVTQTCLDEPGAPEILSPISGARTSGRPVISWKTRDTAVDSVVEVCTDKICANVVATLEGTATAPLVKPLPRGAYFVRGVGRARHPLGHLVHGALATSPRVIHASGRDAVTTQPLGLVNDFDADGQADVFRTDETSGSSSAAGTLRVTLSSGGSTSVAGGWAMNGVGDGAFRRATPREKSHDPTPDHAPGRRPGDGSRGSRGSGRLRLLAVERSLAAR